MTSLLNPTLSPKNGDVVHWRRLQGCAPALAVKSLADNHDQVIVVAENTASMQSILLELAFLVIRLNALCMNFLIGNACPMTAYRLTKTLYLCVLPRLAKLATNQKEFMYYLLRALMQRLPPAEYVLGHSFSLKVNQDVDTEALRSQLIDGGYYSVEQVMAAGEFAFRGGVIDIFPSGAEQPFRLDLFDTVIESIRHFDPETQRSTTTLDAIELLPAREFPLDQDGIQHFRQAYRAHFAGDAKKALIYNAVSDGFAAPGIEFFIPLFFESLSTIFDYCADDAKFGLHGRSAR